MSRFRYRFERARTAARCAADLAARRLAGTRDATRCAADAFEVASVRYAPPTWPAERPVPWPAVVDRDRFATLGVARTRVCAVALANALRVEASAREAYEVASRRCEGFERHRARARQRFAAEEERREEAALDDERRHA